MLVFSSILFTQNGHIQRQQNLIVNRLQTKIILFYRCSWCCLLSYW